MMNKRSNIANHKAMLRYTLTFLFAALASSFEQVPILRYSNQRKQETQLYLLPKDRNLNHVGIGFANPTYSRKRLYFKQDPETTEPMNAGRNQKFLKTAKEQKRDLLIEQKQKKQQEPKIQERRALGGMELFMLPRPVGPNTFTSSYDVTRMNAASHLHDGQWQLLQIPKQQKQRPPMNHIAAFILTSTPSVNALRQALDNAVRTHPLLRARVEGNGYPRMWMDPVRRMVRWNGWENDDGDDKNSNNNAWNGREESPLEFVVNAIDDHHEKIDLDNPPNYWGGSLQVKNVFGTTRKDLDASWQNRFEHDLDSGTVMAVVEDANKKLERGRDLWKLELHQLSSEENNIDGIVCNNDNMPRQGLPCALVMTMNHAISDQGSFNLVMDQILSDIVELENNTSSTLTDKRLLKAPAYIQSVPTCLENSVLGTARRLDLSSLLRSPFSPSQKKLRAYALRKIKEAAKAPALLPENWENNDGTGGSILTPASVLFCGIPLGTEDITQRRSFVQYRTLSPDVTAALVKRSKAHRVPISMTLAAAVVATCADFFDEKSVANDTEGSARHKILDGGKSRMYKILQSLDTRRFPGATDPGDTLSCQASGMDLLVGPLPDFLGRTIRNISKDNQSNEDKEHIMDIFWKVAKQSLDQTSSFLKGGDAIESVRLFDLGMSVCDIGRLVDAYALSNLTKGRTWSAGITNVGEYERQSAVPRQGMLEREQLKVRS